MQLITLKEYAKQKGITYEAVRKQISRYRDELGEHIVRDGRQQFLDEEAVRFLDDHRDRNPVIIFQQNKDEELKALREKNTMLLEKNVELLEQIRSMEVQSARIALLEADAETARQKAADAEKVAQNANLALSEASEEIANLKSDYAQAVETLEKMREEAAQRLWEAQAAEERELQAQRELAEERNRPLTWRERFLGRKL